MRVRLAAFCTIALVLMLVKTPNVFAQTTTITDVSYTKSALFDIDTQTPNPPIIVNATVGYGDAKAGDFLAVGVFELDDGNLVAGLASSNPQSCESTVRIAGCIIPLTNQAGSEKVQFSLDHPKGAWSLALIAALLDNAKNPISNSFSDYTFTISVETALTLTINVPNNVPVNVDGVNGSGGSVQLVLAAGEHTVSVPGLVPVSNTTRLRFSGWSDGSMAANRSVQLNQDITLTGNYVVQYRLQLISPVNADGAGWYDTRTTVTLSIASAVQPMQGIMGILGAKWMFQGWAEGQDEISRVPTATVTMRSAHVINVLWTADYSVPFLSLGLVLLLSVGTLYVTRIRSASRKSRRRSHRRTKRYRLRTRSRTRK